MDYIIFYLSATIKIFALMTPPAVLGAYLQGTSLYDQERKKRTALRTAVAVFIIGVVLYFLGNPLFALFGISLDAFRIGAGALLFLTAISLMNNSPDQNTVKPAEDISVVPLAIPLCMGPAAIGTIMVWGAGDTHLAQKLLSALALLSASSIVYAMLLFADKLGRVLRHTGLEVMAKLTGLLMAAIAAQLVFTGIKSFMQ